MGATQASAGVLAPYIEAARRQSASRPRRAQPRSVRRFRRARRRRKRRRRCRIGAPARSTSPSTRRKCARSRASADALAKRGVQRTVCSTPPPSAPRSRICGDGVIGGLVDRRRTDSSPPSDLTRALVAAARRARRAADRAEPRARHHEQRDGEIVVETDRGSLTRRRGRARRRQLVGRNRDRWRHGAGAGPSGARAAAVARLDGTAAATRHLEQPLLFRAVGRWHDAASARRWRKPASTSARRWRACAICSTRPARSCRTPGRPAFAARASACGRPPRDGLPVIGRVGGAAELMYATGHYRNGVLLAPLTAQLVADAMLDDRIDPVLAAVSPSRFGIVRRSNRGERQCPEKPDERASCGSGDAMKQITIGEARYRLICHRRDGQWIAHAEREDDRRSVRHRMRGAHRGGRGRAAERWLDWQREHAAALEALQQAERAYHRTIAGSAFASPSEGPSPIELQKESLEAVEAARVRLDEVRARRPEGA